MKVFVTGVNGQLGYDVVCEALVRGCGVAASDITSEYSGANQLPANKLSYVSMDITNEEEVGRVLLQERPDVVIHCAAWTAVDAAEEAENIEKVYKINALGTKYIAERCKILNCKMIYISTDYVFDGQGDVPWSEECREYIRLTQYYKNFRKDFNLDCLKA